MSVHGSLQQSVDGIDHKRKGHTYCSRVKAHQFCFNCYLNHRCNPSEWKEVKH